MSETSDATAENSTAGNQKDKFREALERKRNQHHANNGDAHDGSKVHGDSARAGGKRTFRRKSGG